MKPAYTNLDNYMLSTLKSIRDQVNLSGVFEKHSNGTLTYSESAAIELAEQIAKHLNIKSQGLRVIVKNDNGGFYSFLIQNTDALIESFEKVMDIDWSKKTYSVNDGYEWKLKPIDNTSKTLPKSTLMRFKPKDYAELFNSAEDVYNDVLIKEVEDNIETAKKSLERESKIENIKYLKNYIKTLEPYISHIEEIKKIALTVDYERLIEQRELTRKREIANNSEVLTELTKKLSELDIYKSNFDLYEMLECNIYDNIKLVEILILIARNEVKTEKRYNANTQSEEFKYRDLNDWILKKQIEYKDKLSDFKSTFYKVNGSIKSLSRKQLNRHNADKKSIDNLDKIITEILKFID